MFSLTIDGVEVFCDTPEEVRELVKGRVPPGMFVFTGELPDDLADAYESMKLAVMRHHAGGWQEISLANCDHALQVLRNLAHAPPTSEKRAR